MLEYILIPVALLSLIALSWTVFRLLRLRTMGTAVLIRTLPPVGLTPLLGVKSELSTPQWHGWRHGIITYDDDNLSFFRLSSFRYGPSRLYSRQKLDFIGRRDPVGAEIEVISDLVVLELSDSYTSFELALAPDGEMALQSWLESAPNERRQRRRKLA